MKTKLSWMVAMLSSTLLAASAAPAQTNDQGVSATILPGTASVPLAPSQPAPPAIVPGDISINFPSADIAIVAKSVLGDMLHAPFSVARDAQGPVTIVTPYPIARQSVLPFFEDAIGRSGFALIERGGAFEVAPITSARDDAPVGESTVGFGNEIIKLQFVGADQMKTLLDSVLPGVVAQTDPTQNALTLAGTAGQRSSARDLLRQFDVNWLRAMSFGLFIPKVTDARLIAPELDRLLNAPDAPTRGLVRLLTMERLNGILAVSSQPQYLDDVNRWIEVLDREGQSNEPQLFVYSVQNGRSRDLARTINTAFGHGESEAGQSGGSPDGGQSGSTTAGTNGAQTTNPAQDGLGGAPAGPAQAPDGSPVGQDTQRSSVTSAIVTSDDNNNAVIIYGTPRQYALIEKALRQLDVLPVQVLIEAAITEVNLNDDLRYGLQWNFTSGDTNTVLTDSTTSTGLVRAVPGFSFLFANSSLTSVLNTLETRTKINVVSAPKLLVLNNQTAVLQVGDQVPVLTESSVSTISPNAPVINSVEYRDTGVILKVTPRVNATGLVLLDITQEVSDVNTARSASGVASPTISTRKIATSVAVADGEVLALGGLIRNTQSRDRIGLPILSQIPIVGGLFGRHANLDNRIELIVLLRPRVVRSVDDGRAITDELRRKIRTLEPFRSSGQIP